MAIVLDLFALPRGERSRTRKLKDAFFAAYLEKNPDAQRVEVDLVKLADTLPAWDEWDVQTKFEMLYGEGNLDEEMAARWNALSKWTDQLHNANLIVVSTPMWNLSIPWQLKRWIDAVVQARLTFEVTKTGYNGLLGGRPVVLLVSRDGMYPPGSEFRGLGFPGPLPQDDPRPDGPRPLPRVHRGADGHARPRRREGSAREGRRRRRRPRPHALIPLGQTELRPAASPTSLVEPAPAAAPAASVWRQK